MEFDFIEMLKARTASAAIGASAARKMGPKGTIATVRSYLASINIEDFNVNTPDLFKEQLDKKTNELLNQLPKEAQHWGSCRKFLNLYLRDVLYSQGLTEHFKNLHLIGWLEVPLDSHVARGLRGEHDGRSIPRWTTVIGLTPEMSEKYQNFALATARAKGTDRVHLDLIYWRNSEI